jgi:hypothetical protein
MLALEISPRDIAIACGVADPFKVLSTLRRHNILPCGKRGKADLFRIEDVAKKYPAVLQHFKITPETTPTPTARKSRNDAGATRRVSAEDFERICAETKRQYLAVAMPNALLAVRSALAELGDTVNLREFAKSGNTKSAHSSEAEQYFYKRIFERPDCIAKREQWRTLHTQTWRKNDFANKVLPTLRYDLPVMCYNESLVPGSVFVIDDHTTDVRTSEEQYLRSVVVMCGWTGRVLAVEFADIEGCEGQTHGSARTSGEISARHIAMAVLRAAGRFGRPELIVMENSKVMKADALEALLLALYTPQEIHNVPTWITKITHGQGRIARNKPHIPRFPFKGMLERNFAEFKKHDYTTYALTYGSRAEAVQLEIAGKFHAELAPQAEQYVRSLAVYVEGEFLCAHRGVKFSGLAKRSGVACKTIESAWGMLMQNANNSGKFSVPVAPASVAMIMYNLAKMEKINVKPVTARLGFADVVRGGVSVRYQWSAEYWNLLAGRKVAAIEYDDVVFVYEIDGENVRYACTAWRASVESADDVPTLRARQRWERERYEAGGRHIGGRHIGLPVQAGGAQLSESGCARLQDVQDVIEMQDKDGRGEPLWSPELPGAELGECVEGRHIGLPVQEDGDDEQLNRLLNL